METINLNLKNWKKIGDLTLTIGNFDGVHKGHQQLLKEVLKFDDYSKAVMTLEPHPSQFFNTRDFYTLFDVKEKESLMRKYNIDYLLVVDFNKEFSSLSIDEFIDKLKVLGVKRLVLGSDFRFASRGSGSVNDLLKHFEVIVLNDINNDNSLRISTTLIKSLLKEGKIKEANNLLGYEFFISGIVEHGNKVGRTIGFPTANVDYDNSFLPSNGVYIVTMEIENKKYYGVANIGNNPTVNYSRSKKLEVFILDYSKEIYNTIVKVNFIDKIRDELKFNNVEELIENIKNDEKITRNYQKNNKL